jgi:hypothetical protein
MEKPTGVIQKIIESLQQVNALDIYSPIEKDIILHNLRAAYMIFLNIPVEENNKEERLERLFEKLDEKKGEGKREEKKNENEEVRIEKVEKDVEELLAVEFVKQENFLPEETPEREVVIEEPQVTLDVLQELGISEEPRIVENKVIEEPPAFETLVEEIVTPYTQVVEKATTLIQDDIMEFIPDTQPQTTLLFDETAIPKPEIKSLNDLLTEKKDDNSLGSKYQQSNIPDLTKAIAINEKFTFIRELFHNSGVDFSNAVQKLNECENIEAAFVYMEELKHQYLWDTTSSSYLALCDLVRRRFI